MIISAGGTGYDYNEHSAFDADGNIYVCGYFDGTAFFGATSLTSTAGSDLFLAKYNSSGELQWVRQAGGELQAGSNLDRASGIAIIGTDVFITGSFWGTINFNNPLAVGSNEITSAGFHDIFIAKYNSNGDFQWARRAGSGGFDYAYSIAANNTGVYISGYFEGTANFNTPSAAGSNELPSAGGGDIFLAKYNHDGNFQWARRSGKTGDISQEEAAYCIAVNESEVYIAGYFRGTANFNTPFSTGSNEIISAGSNDIFLAKYNTDGDFIWAIRGGGTSFDQVLGIAINGIDIYITGYFQGTANFNNPSASGSNELISAGDGDIYLAKYNSSGDFQWARRAGGSIGDGAYGIAVRDTEVYITGIFQGTINFNNPSAIGSNEITSAGSTDIFLAKYNSSGDFQWAKRAGGTSNENAYGIDVNGKEVLVTGQYQSTINFNTPSLNGSNEITSLGNYDIFIAKYIQSGAYGYIFNDLNENCIKENELGINKTKAIIQPGNIIVETRYDGFWQVDSLPAGTYTITVDTMGKWRSTCDVTQSFTVTDPNALTQAPSFGMSKHRTLLRTQCKYQYALYASWF
jgi:hypothetical protein